MIGGMTLIGIGASTQLSYYHVMGELVPVVSAGGNCPQYHYANLDRVFSFTSSLMNRNLEGLGIPSSDYAWAERSFCAMRFENWLTGTQDAISNGRQCCGLHISDPWISYCPSRGNGFRPVLALLLAGADATISSLQSTPSPCGVGCCSTIRTTFEDKHKSANMFQYIKDFDYVGTVFYTSGLLNLLIGLNWGG
jgi:hypothetical protein